MTTRRKRLTEAMAALADLGLPTAQQNERSALCLLALLDLPAEKPWSNAAAPLAGITPIMQWARDHFGKVYAPNTRETFRRHSMHQFVQAGIALHNPDDPSRPVNSPHTVYQIAPEAVALLSMFGTPKYRLQLAHWLDRRPALADAYARPRALRRIPVQLRSGRQIHLSAGAHSALIKDIVDHFAPRHAPGGELLYVGDTGDRFGYFDVKRFADLSLNLDEHGKLPDVVIYWGEKNWLILLEAVTSHGPIDAKRHQELSALFSSATAGLIYVTAVPNRRTLQKHFASIAWETEVWIADEPDHLIHFDGSRFLGPHAPS
jgi:type II restriction enzyme